MHLGEGTIRCDFIFTSGVCIAFCISSIYCIYVEFMLIYKYLCALFVTDQHHMHLDRKFH